MREFENYLGPLDLIGGWIQTVLGIFTEPLPPRLYTLERRYSSSLESEEMMMKFSVPKSACEQLRHLFYSRCAVTIKAELSVESWVDWLCGAGYSSPEVAKTLFLAKMSSLKSVWRFVDFAEFCMIFGAGSMEAKANAVCLAFHQRARMLNQSKNNDDINNNSTSSSVSSSGDDSPTDISVNKKVMRRMVLLLAQKYDRSSYPSPRSRTSSGSNATVLSPKGAGASVPQSPAMQRSLPMDQSQSTTDLTTLITSKQTILSSPMTPMSPPSPMTSISVNTTTPSSSSSSSSKTATMSILTLYNLLESDYDFDDEILFAPAAVKQALDVIEKKSGPSLSQYADLLVDHQMNLPGLHELTMAACCLFGIRPTAPVLEKEFVMELMLRRQAEYPQTRAHPFGPVDTDWCVISKSWWDSWRFYVGHKRLVYADPSMQEHMASPPEPAAIDNWIILKKNGVRQLLHGTMRGHHLEVIPPTVYNAIHSWYGGGPKIVRRVILGPSNSTELELFPVCLRICTCDANGKARDIDRELLFSKTATIAAVCSELCEYRNIDISKVRLWNYARSSWKDQYIISPELTISEANLQDGQTVLLEISLPDGRWPRSKLNASLGIMIIIIPIINIIILILFNINIIILLNIIIIRKRRSRIITERQQYHKSIH